MILSRFIMVLFVMALSVISPGCFKSSPNAEDYMASARDYYQSGDLDRARVQLRNALRENSTIAEAYYLLSLISEARGNIYVAYADMQRAKELAPKDPKIAVEASEYLVLTAQFKEAEKNMRQLLAVAPDNIDALRVLAASQIGLQAYKRALDAATQGLVVSPDDIELLALKAVSLKFLGHLKDATQVVNRLVQSDSNNIPYHLLMLETSQLQADRQAIETSLIKLTQLQPDNPRFAMTLAKIFYGENNRERALSVLQKFNDANPENTTVKRILLDIVEEQNSDKAKALLATFLEQLPKDPGLHFYQVGKLLADNSLEKAREILTGIVAEEAFEPDVKVQAHVILARLDIIQGVLKGAAMHVAKALTFDPFNKDALGLQAQLYIHEGNFGEAYLVIERALSRTPEDIPLLQMQALILEQQAELIEARRVYQHILKLDPSHAIARQIEFKALLKEKEIWAAKKLLDAASDDQKQRLNWQLQALEWEFANKNWHAAKARLKLIENKGLLSWKVDYFKAKIAAGLQQGDAVSRYKKVIQQQPEFVAAYDELYRLLPDNAQPFIEWLIDFEQERTAVPAAVLLAKLSRDRGDLDTAIRVLRRSVANNPSWIQGYKLLADHLLWAKRGGEAVAVYEKVLVLHPNEAFLLLSQATLYTLVGDWTAAANVYEKLLVVTPRSLVVRNNYALLLMDESLRSPESIRKAIDFTKDFSRTDNASLLDTYGWVLRWAGEYKAAEHALNIALEFDPKNADIQYHLIDTLIASGQYDKAQFELEKNKATILGPKVEVLERRLRDAQNG